MKPKSVVITHITINCGTRLLSRALISWVEKRDPLVMLLQTTSRQGWDQTSHRSTTSKR